MTRGDATMFITDRRILDAGSSARWWIHHECGE